MRLEGIHHISCITGDARGNLDFYTGVLGLRLVAKTVNQDDPTVYHLFYADEAGTPGAEMTFFEYPGARRGRAGAGMVHTVIWRVPGEPALEFWRDRLLAHDIEVESVDERIRFRDPEGLAIELEARAVSDPDLVARHPEIPAEVALAGFAGVRAYVDDSAPSGRVLADVLGAERISETAWELRGQRRGATIELESPPSERAVPGAGTVHHVAWHTTVDEHPRWLDRLREGGVESTPVIDRHYFRSIYFREPGGVLYEIADDGPGFTVDGPEEELGSRVILPPRFEPYRRRLEERLTPLPDPRSDW